MKICTKCGAELFDNATTCPECGRFVGSKNKLSSEEQTNSPVQKQEQPKSVPITEQTTAVPQARNIEPVQNIQKPDPVVQQPIQQQNNVYRKFCTNCGAEVFNNTQFCANCGYSRSIVSAPRHETQYQQPTSIPQLRRFCSKCGSEVVNGATVCTTCGCRVGQAPAATQYQQQKQGFQNNSVYQQSPAAQQQPSYQTRGYEKKESGVPLILNFIGSILVAASVFFWLLGIVDCYISVGKYNVWISYGDQIIAGFVCAAAVFAMGVTSLIVSLVQKAKKDYVFSAIIHIVIGVALALPALMSGMF